MKMIQKCRNIVSMLSQSVICLTVMVFVFAMIAMIVQIFAPLITTGLLVVGTVIACHERKDGVIAGLGIVIYGLSWFSFWTPIQAVTICVVGIACYFYAFGRGLQDIFDRANKMS